MADTSRESGEEARREGISRRELIARGAVAGAVVWTAPLIASTPAFGADTATSLPPCTHYYAVRFTPATAHDLFLPVPDWPDPDMVEGPSAATGVLDAPNRYGVCAEILTWKRDHSDITVGYDKSKAPQLVASPNHGPWIVLLPAGPVPGPIDDTRLVIARGRAGNLCCPAYIDPNPPDPNQAGRRIVFPSCHHDAQIHSVQLIYCFAG